MKHSDYWKERFARLEASGNRIGKNIFRQVEEMYAKAEKEITDKIELWYERLAKNNEISMTEARKLLSGRSLKEFRWSVEEYIEYGRKNAIDSAWMKELENASARAHISRLEAVKADIQQSVEKLYGNQLDAIDAGVRKVYTDGYYRTAFEIQKGFGVGFEMAAIGEGALSKVINKPWAPDGMNFSDRIWRNKKKLLNELHGSLTRNILTGAAPDTAIRELAERMHVSRTVAGRLIMTESAFFQSAAQRDCFNDLDVEQYEIVATLDNRTSDICQRMDKRVFDTKDLRPGVTAPPFHVYCRSTTAPYFDDWEEFGIQLSRAARDEDGKTYSVGDMSYEEWKEVTGNKRNSSVGADSGRQAVKRFSDITEKWVELPKEEAHEVYEIAKYTHLDGREYEVDGKNIKFNYSLKEREVAELLAKYRKKVGMCPVVVGDLQGIKTPDFIIDGAERWDLKEIFGGSKDAFRNAVHKKREQANNFIIDVTHAQLSDEQVSDQAEKIFEWYNTEFVDRLVITKNNRIFRVLKRN